MPTWNTSAQPVLTEHCQPCHASTSPDRNGAPEDITFDTPEQTLELASCIEDSSLSESPWMPPAVPMPEIDKVQLQAWLWCSE